jgi:hypothetical protein
MVGVIYVPWKYHEYAEEIFASLERQDVDLKLYIVTNGEPDTRRIIENKVIPKHPSVDVVFIDDGGVNHGFAKGNNLGIEQALQDGCSEIFLNNGDLVLEDGALSKLKNVLRSDDEIATVQPLVTYYKDHTIVNTSGGVYHLLGYAFARDNLNAAQPTSNYKLDLAYVTGAALMVKAEVLRKIGLLEEGFFMYQEDVEFGLRALLAGYKNRLVPGVMAYHDYAFGSNVQMFGWIEHYRWLTVLSYYKLPTLLLVLPLLVLHDLAMWPMAILGGWLKWKWWAFLQWFKPSTWRLFFHLKSRAMAFRTVSDTELLGYVSGTIEAQEKSNMLVDKIANPVIRVYLKILRRIVHW